MIKPTHNFGFLLYVHPLSVFLIPKCLRDRERELSFFDRKNIVSPYMIKVVYRYDDDHLKHKSEQKMCFRLFCFFLICAVFEFEADNEKTRERAPIKAGE